MRTGIGGLHTCPMSRTMPRISMFGQTMTTATTLASIAAARQGSPAQSQPRTAKRESKLVMSAATRQVRAIVECWWRTSEPTRRDGELADVYMAHEWRRRSQDTIDSGEGCVEARLREHVVRCHDLEPVPRPIMLARFFEGDVLHRVAVCQQRCNLLLELLRHHTLLRTLSRRLERQAQAQMG